ncbi:hypothetical protein F4861DRAFT_85404 [Xylaria intraflava]|nr:hypothetical protein F4861DRAFT_85404 [Xylaria intraflava]
MGVQFFSNWELWEQLTFVLAAGIVSVFFIGWIKLWWSQRLLKKYALLDEEKRLRQTELRKSGLPVGRRVDIPFGVRAIQSGIEVEGIWISRPATPIEPRTSSKASSTTCDIDSEPRPEDKGKAVMGSAAKQPATITVAEAESTPRLNPRFGPAAGYVDQRTLRPSSPQYPMNDSPYLTRPLNSTPQPEDAATRSHIEIYIPTSSASSVNSSLSPRVRPAVDRMSISSEEGLNLPTSRYPAEVRGRPVGLSPHYRSPVEDMGYSSMAGPSAARGKYCSRVRAETRGNLLESPELEKMSSSPGPPPVSRFSLASTRPVPVRIYTNQRDTIHNTSSRVVNPGFEVLPAGTFGRPGGEAAPLNDGAPGLAR